MPNFVQEYRSTDVGMPALTGQVGSLTAVLDAVLVNGGATQPVTSLVQSGTTVTATIPADVSLENLDWLVIAGATPAGANGTVQIAFIDSTHFTYQAAAGLGTITGSITYRRAPLGWTKFSGTNVAAYQSAVVPGCPQFWLRVDDSNTVGTTGGVKEACARGYEVMTDVNTGTGPFPSVGQLANGLCWRKSTTADATPRPWSIIGDGATFYLHVNSDGTATLGRIACGFGAFTTFKIADAFNCFIGGTNSFNAPAPSATSLGLGYTASPATSPGFNNGLYIARSMSQVGGSVTVANVTRLATTGNMGGINGVIANPSPADGGVWVDNPLFFDASLACRGRPRGLYYHCHNVNPFGNDYDIAINVAGLPGVTLMNILHCGGNATGSILYDRYGPW
jgi:hypothetical protein